MCVGQMMACCSGSVQLSRLSHGVSYVTGLCCVMWSCGHVVMWSCGHVVMWSCRHVVMSSCRHVVMSSCRHVVMSSCRHVVMSSCMCEYIYTLHSWTCTHFHLVNCSFYFIVVSIHTSGLTLLFSFCFVNNIVPNIIIIETNC